MRWHICVFRHHNDISYRLSQESMAQIGNYHRSLEGEYVTTLLYPPKCYLGSVKINTRNTWTSFHKTGSVPTLGSIRHPHADSRWQVFIFF
jgi:hypothetical protein